MKRILVVLANPRGTNSLRLDEELRVIRECIGRSNRRDEFQLDFRPAATVDDLSRALLDAPFDIVHLLGPRVRAGLRPGR